MLTWQNNLFRALNENWRGGRMGSLKWELYVDTHHAFFQGEQLFESDFIPSSHSRQQPLFSAFTVKCVQFSIAGSLLALVLLCATAAWIPNLTGWNWWFCLLFGWQLKWSDYENRDAQMDEYSARELLVSAWRGLGNVFCFVALMRRWSLILNSVEDMSRTVKKKQLRIPDFIGAHVEKVL